MPYWLANFNVGMCQKNHNLFYTFIHIEYIFYKLEIAAY